MAESAPLDFSGRGISDPALRGKYIALRARLADLGDVLIGFSGGVDSTLLAAVARDTLGRDKAKACIAVGPSLAEREKVEAHCLAEMMDVELIAYPATEFENPAYVANGPDRCYHCKADLFLHLGRFAARMRTIRRDASPGSAAAGPALLYGGNLDDTRDFRPGRKAAETAGALAPLAEAGLGKAEVRALSRAIGLPTADKPAQPCLSSRIPYGSAVTPAKLAAVEAGEEALAALGFREYRLRHYGDAARIEVPEDQMGLLTPEARSALEATLFRLGFARLEIDPEGFRSGKLNRVLSRETLDRFTEGAPPSI